MGSLFSNRSKTNTSGTQSGTTQSNIWDQPGLQDFLSSYNQQFTGPQISQTTAPANAYQLGAADNQTGIATGLGGAFGTANAISAAGIGPSNIAAWMNPYEDQVVNNLISDFGSANAREMSNITGRAAGQGALGNSNVAVAQRLATDAQREGLDRAIASTRQAGFGQAAGLATQDAQTRLAGAGMAGNLTNAATGANAGLGSLGQNIWQTNLASTMLPYQLYAQGIQGYQGLGQLAGQNYSGQTTGTSTTTQTPSIGSIGLGLLGTVLSGWPGGGGKAHGGAVKAKADGGAVGSSFADKVVQAHQALEKMRKGGRVSKAEGGGIGDWTTTVTPASSPGMNFRGLGTPMGNMARGLGEMREDPGAAMLARDQSALSQRMSGLMGRQGFAEGGTPAPWWAPHAVLQRFLPDSWTGRTPTYRPDFSEFSAQPTVGDYALGAPRPADAAPPQAPLGQDPMRPFGMDTSAFERPATSDLTSRVSDATINGPPWQPDASEFTEWRPKPLVTDAALTDMTRDRQPHTNMPSWMPFSTGLWAGERATPLQRFGMALTQVGNGPFAGFGKSMSEQAGELQRDRAAELEARRLQSHLAQQREQVEHQRRALTETERHNRATEANRNQNRPETAFETAIAQASAKDLEARTAAVRSAQDRMGHLDRLNVLLSDPNVPQGRFANWEVEGRRIAGALFPGVNMAGVPEAEAARAISNNLALQLRSTAGGEGMPGAMSDQDRNFLLQSIPRLENTRQGNQVMITLMRAAEEYKIAANGAAMEYIRQNRTNVGLDRYMAEWMRTNPMLTDSLRRQIDTASRGAAPSTTTTAPAAAPAVGDTREEGGWVWERRADGRWHPVRQISNAAPAGAP